LELPVLVRRLLRAASLLERPMRTASIEALVALIRSVDACCSMRLEGFRLKWRDVESAMRRPASRGPARRSLELRLRAQFDLTAGVEAQIESLEPDEICSAEFLRSLHEGFYRSWPGPVRKHEPGQLRPDPGLDLLLRQFHEVYGPIVGSGPASLIAAAAAHYRLLWMRPFPRGNGLVARLFSHGWFIKAGVPASNLWSLSRALARSQGVYENVAANAMRTRRITRDGQGPLSQRYLREFCEFFLRTIIEEIEFMRQTLEPDAIERRMLGHASACVAAGKLPGGSSLVVRELYSRGELRRGDVSGLMAVSPRTAQKVVGALVTNGFAVSPSEKGLLRPAFQANTLEHYFPGLVTAD
jgi:hypothetical protein